MVVCGSTYLKSSGLSGVLTRFCLLPGALVEHVFVLVFVVVHVFVEQVFGCVFCGCFGGCFGLFYFFV